nr:MAG TPA: hypothetical protein [Caudoviricetes sp.]
MEIRIWILKMFHLLSLLQHIIMLSLQKLKN